MILPFGEVSYIAFCAYNWDDSNRKIKEKNLVNNFIKKVVK